MKILKKLFLIFAFLYLCIIFLPKTNLFYLAQEQALKQNVIISQESLSDVLGIFSASNSKIYYDGLLVGNVKTIRLIPALFYNCLSISDAKFNSGFAQFIPKSIDSLKLRFTLFFPVRVFISSDGDFGDISGHFDLINQKLHLVLEPKKGFMSNYPELANQFKKINNEYVYETSYKF